MECSYDFGGGGGVRLTAHLFEIVEGARDAGLIVLYGEKNNWHRPSSVFCVIIRWQSEECKHESQLQQLRSQSLQI